MIERNLYKSLKSHLAERPYRYADALVNRAKSLAIMKQLLIGLHPPGSRFKDFVGRKCLLVFF